MYKATANSSSSNITPVKMDMSSETDIQALAEKLAIQHPEGLYALVNNNNNTVVGKDGLIEWMSIDNYKMYVGSFVVGAALDGVVRDTRKKGQRLPSLLSSIYFLHFAWKKGCHTPDHARRTKAE